MGEIAENSIEAQIFEPDRKDYGAIADNPRETGILEPSGNG